MENRLEIGDLARAGEEETFWAREIGWRDDGYKDLAATKIFRIGLEGERGGRNSRKILDSVWEAGGIVGMENGKGMPTRGRFRFGFEISNRRSISLDRHANAGNLSVFAGISGSVAPTRRARVRTILVCFFLGQPDFAIAGSPSEQIYCISHLYECISLKKNLYECIVLKKKVIRMHSPQNKNVYECIA